MATRIVELFIEDMDDESGIEAISLVGRPAHDETWLAFNHEEVEEYSPYKIVPENFCDNVPLLDTLGEPYSQLIEEGWEILRVEKMTPQSIIKLSEEKEERRRDKFSSPNEPSVLDTPDYRIRFKYVGPRDEKNRKFCSDMLAKNRVYRIEDIDELTDSVANEEFGYYNIMLWRGSFNCRHTFVRLIYKREGTIVNSASSTRGLDRQEGLGPNLQPDTRTSATIANVGQPGSKQWKPGVPREGKFAEGGLENACWPGYEAIGTKILDGKEVPNCVPVKMTDDDFAESISDYPESVKNAAKRAVEYADKNGWGSCGTDVGKQRASQLSKGENISVDTLKRMYSYLSRHKGDLDSSKSYEDGCGKLMYDSWGGEAGLDWSERKLKQLEGQQEFSKKEKMLFYDDDKRVLVGAAMVPNKMIHRYDTFGNLYYVFFSKETIKKMADKFLKQKRTDETSIEHNGLKLGADKVYITESWVSEDPIKDKSAAYGFNLPAGTWYVSMKVEDPKVWELVKSKMLTGFSVEGLFAEKSVFSKEAETINTIKNILKSITDE
jgi:hypothetical protein